MSGRKSSNISAGVADRAKDDDGSVDESSAICERLKKEDDRITVIHQTNSGLVNVRKAGLDIARGEYIGFVDGDDYVEKEMFQRLLEVIDSTDADFVH